jgi:hypothetical protein
MRVCIPLARARSMVCITRLVCVLAAAEPSVIV